MGIVRNVARLISRKFQRLRRGLRRGRILIVEPLEARNLLTTSGDGYATCSEEWCLGWTMSVHAELTPATEGHPIGLTLSFDDEGWHSTSSPTWGRYVHVWTEDYTAVNGVDYLAPQGYGNAVSFLFYNNQPPTTWSFPTLDNFQVNNSQTLKVHVRIAGSSPVAGNYYAESEVVLDAEISNNTYAPVALDDSYSVEANGMLSRPDFLGVLANDNDPEGYSMSATVVSEPAHGTLWWNHNGGFVYFPDAGFKGTDSFVYAAGDAGVNYAGNVNNWGLTTTATVTIAVLNRAPIAVNDIFTMDPVQTPTLAVDELMGVLANDRDADDDDFYAFLEEDVAHGDLTLSGDGSFTYTPDEGFNGVDSFKYKAHDGLAESTATVRIAVNNTAPVAHDIVFGQPLVDVEFSGNVFAGINKPTDADGDALTAVLVAAPSTGTFAFSPSGQFTFTAPPYVTGLYTFTFKVTDGYAFSNVVTGKIFPLPHAYDDEYVMLMNGSLARDDDRNLLTNDKIPEIVPTTNNQTFLSVYIRRLLQGGEQFGRTQHGALTIYDDGTFLYTPDTGYTGDDYFAYEIVDYSTTTSPVHDWGLVTIHVSAS
jgi:VCBS repeat-containing protein